MSLVIMKSLMQHAQENKYAVGYFEAWNLEAVLAVIDAAEKTNSPIIIGFSGMFLGNDQRKVEENIYHYGALGRAIAENSKVPTAFLLNESDRMDLLIRGLKAGFNAVMYQKPGESFHEQLDITKYLVKTAHYCGADVESEVGELPTADISTNTMSKGKMTDPDQAACFVEQTGIDALAVAVGNVHLLEGGKSALDFDLIKALRKKISVPLVLHGGTGISAENLKEAINLGMCKINVGTVLKRVFINSIHTYLMENKVDSIDPHEVIGKGGSKDMLCRARNAVTEEVVRFIKIFGSENKAEIV
jgi:ketose-bisphosphate aldolase